jgi:hypothetical protein
MEELRERMEYIQSWEEKVQKRKARKGRKKKQAEPELQYESGQDMEVVIEIEV